ncbi:klaroid protein-like [Plodia interpunctella]|uniref:klaroid protein-like n=1 Tax=Plodia interpunctella TaxID=58824 RepID=UPI0023677BA3|nr:klaroid protein-like [Plodia interpunctella]
MENPTVSELRSRSRSKTPFLRSSCDRENCNEPDNHTHHKSGRKTPIRRSTPVKQLHSTNKVTSTEPIIEIDDEEPLAHRTRQSTRSEKVKTSDYSSEDNSEKGHVSKEIFQNEINSRYERVATTSRYTSFGDFTLSPIHTAHNVTLDRSTRFGSPAYSACSTDSSFAEQALADTSALLDRDPSAEHLPYRLYKMAGEYWNKYPKTDYTYSPLSKDRVELAPGQVAVPNMSRRSLSQFRIQGPNTTADEVDRLVTATWQASAVRKRFTNIDSSDDEGTYLRGNGGYHQPDQRWLLTRLLVAILTTVTTATSSAYRKVVGPSHRYPYTDRRPAQAGIVSRTASVAAAPFYWLYSIIKTVITTTVTTVTETVTSNHVSASEKYSRSQTKVAKRRWWPWLLLLLLPAVGYGCYNYSDQIIPQTPVIVDTYKSPQIVQDPDLSKRMAALEDWAINVDTKLKTIDQKLSNFDNLEAQIEQYSLKYLQQNLIQVFNLNDNSEAIAAKLKTYFDNQYLTKEQMQVLSQEIHERLISSWKPEMDEDKIRLMIQEYLSVFERRQMELVTRKVREYLREVEVHHHNTGFDVEAVKKIVAGMLEVYDADKTGLVDYALESAGGQVVSTKCTELYQIKTKQYSILGLPVWWVYTTPRFALTPGAMPAECWAFQGFPGYLVVRTYAIIEVTGFSLEHMSRLLAVDGKIESAPKNFSVYGLHGEMDPEPHLFGDYIYDANGTSIQYFPVKYPKTTNIGGVNYPVAYDIIELRVESNHGNPTYTCIYRFRVHGNPLSDIRKATEDSIKESES